MQNIVEKNMNILASDAGISLLQSSYLQSINILF